MSSDEACCMVVGRGGLVHGGNGWSLADTRRSLTDTGSSLAEGGLSSAGAGMSLADYD